MDVHDLDLLPLEEQSYLPLQAQPGRDACERAGAVDDPAGPHATDNRLIGDWIDAVSSIPGRRHEGCDDDRVMSQRNEAFGEIVNVFGYPT